MDVRLRTVEDPEVLRARAQEIAPLCGEMRAPWDGGEVDVEGLEERMRREATAREFIFVEATPAEREADADRIGFAWTLPFEDPLGGHRLPMLVLLWVHPDWRHRGLARLIMEDARRQLEERGFPRLLARAGYNDDAVISMGERWGFTRAWEMMEFE